VCGRKWVRASVGYDKRLWNWHLLPLRSAHKFKNIGGDIGIHEEIHLRNTHGYFLLQIPCMFKNKTSFVNTNLKCF
jgi:hypothetical protein